MECTLLLWQAMLIWAEECMPVWSILVFVARKNGSIFISHHPPLGRTCLSKWIISTQNINLNMRLRRRPFISVLFHHLFCLVKHALKKNPIQVWSTFLVLTDLKTSSPTWSRLSTACRLRTKSQVVLIVLESSFPLPRCKPKCYSQVHYTHFT